MGWIVGKWYVDFGAPYNVIKLCVYLFFLSCNLGCHSRICLSKYVSENCMFKVDFHGQFYNV